MPNKDWKDRQKLAQKDDAFYYGDGGTIHDSGEVNIERDEKTGKVVAVWFRCMMLPFTDHVVGEGRAQDMMSSYETVAPKDRWDSEKHYPKSEFNSIKGIEFITRKI